MFEMIGEGLSGTPLVGECGRYVPCELARAVSAR